MCVCIYVEDTNRTVGLKSLFVNTEDRLRRPRMGNREQNQTHETSQRTSNTTREKHLIVERNDLKNESFPHPCLLGCLLLAFRPPVGVGSVEEHNNAVFFLCGASCPLQRRWCTVKGEGGKDLLPITLFSFDRSAKCGS